MANEPRVFFVFFHNKIHSFILAWQTHCHPGMAEPSDNKDDDFLLQEGSLMHILSQNSVLGKNFKIPLNS